MLDSSITERRTVTAPCECSTIHNTHDNMIIRSLTIHTIQLHWHALKLQINTSLVKSLANRSLAVLSANILICVSVYYHK